MEHRTEANMFLEKLSYETDEELQNTNSQAATFDWGKHQI